MAVSNKNGLVLSMCDGACILMLFIKLKLIGRQGKGNLVIMGHKMREFIEGLCLRQPFAGS